MQNTGVITRPNNTVFKGQNGEAKPIQVIKASTELYLI